MEIKYITLDDLLPLRMQILRPGKPREDAIYPGDDDGDTFHLGLYNDRDLVTIASFYKEDKEGYEGTGYRLRSMATLPEMQSKGFGKKILEFAFNELENKGCSYLWCNARTTASGYYEKLGFEIISDEFDIKDIGPHYVMKINL